MPFEECGSCRNKIENTKLTYFECFRLFDFAEKMIECGSNSNSIYNDQALLTMCVKKGYTQIAEKMILCGCDVNFILNDETSPVIFDVIQTRNEKLLTALCATYGEFVTKAPEKNKMTFQF